MEETVGDGEAVRVSKVLKFAVCVCVCALALRLEAPRW